MAVPRRVRQWDIFRANLGEPSDVWLLIVSSSETNAIIESVVTACEIVPESLQRLTPSPLNLPVKPSDTGLEWPATASVVTVSCIPTNCLVSLEGRLEPAGVREATLKGLQILFGIRPWP